MKGEVRFLGVIFTVLGLAILAFGVYFIFDTISFVNRSATTAEGTVVEVERKFLREGTIIVPTVTFVTEEGRSIVFTSNTGRGGWKDRIGESVTVRYDPADPTNAKIDSFYQLWGLSAIFFGIGGMFIVFGRLGKPPERAKGWCPHS
jgi:hypothetical protein